MTVEKELRGVSGWAMAMVMVLGSIAAVFGFVSAVHVPKGLVVLPVMALVIVWAIWMYGFAVVNPNEARVVTLFGVYKGTLRQPGFWWVSPFTTRRRLSLRIRNFESGKLKVNDRDANPIEIAAVVVWRLVDTFEAAFNVDDYENFMHVQTEAALRNLASSYPYDAHDEERVSLRLSA